MGLIDWAPDTGQEIAPETQTRRMTLEELGGEMRLVELTRTTGRRPGFALVHRRRTRPRSTPPPTVDTSSITVRRQAIRLVAQARPSRGATLPEGPGHGDAPGHGGALATGEAVARGQRTYSRAPLLPDLATDLPCRVLHRVDVHVGPAVLDEFDQVGEIVHASATIRDMSVSEHAGTQNATETAIDLR